MVCARDGDTDFFNIVTVVLQRDTLAPYVFIICLDFVLRTSIDLIKDSFFFKKRNSRYPAKTITDANNAADQALHANTPTQTKSWLHSFEQVAVGISLHLSTNQTEFIRFKQKSISSSLSCKPLKLIGQFT